MITPASLEKLSPSVLVLNIGLKLNSRTGPTKITDKFTLCFKLKQPFTAGLC